MLDDFRCSLFAISLFAFSLTDSLPDLNPLIHHNPVGHIVTGVAIAHRRGFLHIFHFTG